MNKCSILLPLSLILAVPALAEDWPQFRGSQRDNVSRETGLYREWPAEGPKVLWSMDMAVGYAAPAVHAGRVFVHDYDRDSSEWQVRALTLADGQELWRFGENRRIRPNHGITRTVPATDGKTVFSLDPKAVLHALDAETGKELWRRNLVEDFETRIPPWYMGQCPLLEDDRLIIATGGAAVLVALNKVTGEEIWRTPNPEGLLMSHASIMPATLGGVRQYLYNVMTGTVGVAADDGRLLWYHPFKFNVAVAPSPLAIDGERVFITSGYDAGSAMLAVRKQGDGFEVEQLFSLTSGEWNSEVHTPVLWKEHLFAVGKKKRGLFTCLDDQGKEIWSSEGKASFGMGSFLLADGMFFVLEGATGQLRLLEATLEGYRELASAKVLPGDEAWAPMALSGGRLLLRDNERLVCLQVGEGG